MTEGFSTDPHPDLDALADLHAEVPGTAPSTLEHISGCPRCTAELAALDRLPGTLAAAGSVGPMPVEVVTAVDAALAAEAAAIGVADVPAGADVTAVPDAVAARTVTPIAGRARSPWGMRVLQAAAVLVLLLAGVGIGVSALGGGSDGDSSTAGGTADSAGAPKAAESGAYPLTASGRDWNADAVSAEASKLLAGTLSPPVAAQALREQYAARDDGDSSGGGSDPEDSALARADASAARLAGGPALAECVAALVDGPQTPLAVDISTWQQQPAAVIVLPAPGEPSRAEVWVVSPSCSTKDAKLLYYASIPR